MPVIDTPTPPVNHTEREHVRSAFRHTSIYGLGTVLSKAIGFVMIPIYTHLLSTADYGVLELLSMTTDVFAMVTGMGLSWAVTRYYYRYDETRDRNLVISSAVILVIVAFGTTFLLALPLATPIARLVLGSSSFAPLVRLALTAFFLGSLIEIPMVSLRARQQSVRVVRLGLYRLLCHFSLNILFLVVLRQGVAGLLYSSIITAALFGAYLTGSVLKETGIHYSRTIARQLLRYGGPVILANLASFTMHYSDRYFLRVYADLNAVGIYSLAYKFAMLLSLFIVTPFAQSWVPKALEIEKAHGKDGMPILRSILGYFNVALVGAALVLSLFAADIIRVMASPQFTPAAGVIPILAVGIIFFGYRQVSYIGAWVRERSDLIAGASLLSTAVVLAANALFIPRLGISGAALATVAAFGTEYFVMRHRSERLFPLGYTHTRLLEPLLVATVLYVAVELVLPNEAGILVTTAVRALAVLLFGGALIARGHLRWADLNGLLSVIGNWAIRIVPRGPSTG